MPRVVTISGIAVNIYPKDHNPPHVHAVFAGDEVQIGIVGAVVINGNLPRPQLAKARAWVMANEAHLMTLWAGMQ